MIDRGIAPIGDYRLGIVQVAIRPPHLARFADGCRHGRIDNDVARHVKIGNAVIGIHHCQIRTIGQTSVQIRFYLIALGLRQTLDFVVGIAHAVVGVNAQFGKDVGVFAEGIPVIGFHCMTENNGVRHLHHRCFQMQGEQHTLLRARNLFVVELA